MSSYKKKSPISTVVIVIVAIYLVFSFVTDKINKADFNIELFSDNDSSFKIIATDEAKDICNLVENYSKSKGYNIKIDYAGSIEIIDKLNQGQKYDAVFLSNSIWMAMLDKVKITDYDTVSIDPVVFGVKKSKAMELGLIKDDLKLEEITSKISSGNLQFIVPSGTQTNTGASSLLGFVNVLCGSPEVLTKQDVENESLSEKLKELYSGVNRTSGSESFVEQQFLTGKYDAAVLYETSVININKKIKDENEQIYALYPIDGVSVSDLLFGYIDNKNDEKQKIFEDLKKYVLSDNSQNELLKKGYRVWYGGIKEDTDPTVFNKAWGIDTSKYITPIKYPSLDVIKKI